MLIAQEMARSLLLIPNHNTSNKLKTS